MYHKHCSEQRYTSVVPSYPTKIAHPKLKLFNSNLLKKHGNELVQSKTLKCKSTFSCFQQITKNMSMVGPFLWGALFMWGQIVHLRGGERSVYGGKS